MSRDRLAEIRRWIENRPPVGCLLCVGKLEDIRWLTRRMIELERLTLPLSAAPTEPMPIVSPVSAWNAIVGQVVASTATAFVYARRDHLDLYATERRVLDAVRALQRPS